MNIEPICVGALFVSALAFAYFLGWRMALAHVVRKMEQMGRRGLPGVEPEWYPPTPPRADVETTRRNDVPKWHPEAGRE